MTTALDDISWSASATGVYLPQDDSRLLAGVIRASGAVPGRAVADLCTGSGVLAIAALAAGAASVRAFDICPRAVHRARANVAAFGGGVHVHLGPWQRAGEFGPYDVVVANPPYVPDSGLQSDQAPASAGPALAWNAGQDGRSILDPLCSAAAQFLSTGGSVFIVQSEFAGIDRTLRLLSQAGLSTGVVARQHIPFGPVLSARAAWMERRGLVEPGRRVEELVVIRADKS